MVLPIIYIQVLHISTQLLNCDLDTKRVLSTLKQENRQHLEKALSFTLVWNTADV